MGEEIFKPLTVVLYKILDPLNASGAKIFRPLKFLLCNFRPLIFSGKNFRPLEVVWDPLNLVA